MRKALHIIGLLSDSDVEWLVAHGTMETFPKGAVLIYEGQPIEALMILMDGRLSVKVDSVDSMEVAALYTGEIIGEISFVDSRAPSASVVAAHDSQVFRVPAGVLRGKLERDDGFAARFYRALAVFLATRLRSTTDRLGYGPVTEVGLVEIDEERFDDVALAAKRFDDVLKRLRTH